MNNPAAYTSPATGRVVPTGRFPVAVKPPRHANPKEKSPLHPINQPSVGSAGSSRGKTMERLIARFWLARIVRDLPIGLELAMTVFGALSMLTAVSLFALDRLGFVTAMQQDAAAQSATQQQVQRGLIAAQELRAISRELQVQQSVRGIRSTLDRATK